MRLILMVLLLSLTACSGVSQPADSPAADEAESSTSLTEPTGETADVVEVQVELYEFGFLSSVESLEPGTRYRFVVHNTGTVEHEWVLLPAGGSAEMMSAAAEADGEDAGGETSASDTDTGATDDDMGLADDHDDEGMASDHDDEGMADDHDDEGMADEHGGDGMADEHGGDGMADEHGGDGMADESGAMSEDHDESEAADATVAADDMSSDAEAEGEDPHAAHGAHDHGAVALAQIPASELQPGATAIREVTIPLDAGDLEFGCHLPGHFESGMVLTMPTSR